MTEKPWIINGMPMDDDEAVKYLANQRMLLSRQLAEVIAERDALRAQNEGIQVLLDRNAAISAENSFLVDELNATKAKLDAVPGKAIGDMWAMTPYCEMTDTATLDAVKQWLITVQP